MNKNNLLMNLGSFPSISLSQLHTSMSFYKKLDKKYLLTMNDLPELLEKLKQDFRILEITGKKIFSYDNVYMDTDDYLFYQQEQQKKKKRVKVRTRYYVETNSAFFEFKAKQKDTTSKFRYDFPPEEHGFITRGKKRFFDGVWQSIFESQAPKITPAIQTQYERISFISKDGTERITLDFHIQTKDLRATNAKNISLTNLVILESKSMKKKSIATKIMKEQGFKKAKNCSKYCLGVIYSGLAKKYDTFIETIEKIKEIRIETVKKKQRKAHLEKIQQEDINIVKIAG